MVKESFLIIDAIAQRDNVFTRMDARVKLFLCCCILASMTAVPGLKLPLSVLILAVAATVFIKVPIKLIVGRLLPPLVFGLIFLIIMLFSEGANPLFTISVLGFQLSAYSEGLNLGLFVLARIVASISVILFLSISTPIYELGRAMMWFKIPGVVVELLLLTYRYIFVLWDEGMRIREAQYMRLGYSTGRPGGWKRAIKSTVTLMGMVIIRAYDRSENTFSAMRLRGYNGGIGGSSCKVWSRVETSYLLSGLLAITVLITVCT